MKQFDQMFSWYKREIQFLVFLVLKLPLNLNTGANTNNNSYSTLK